MQYCLKGAEIAELYNIGNILGMSALGRVTTSTQSLMYYKFFILKGLSAANFGARFILFQRPFINL